MKSHAQYAMVQHYRIDFQEPEDEQFRRLFHVILANEHLLHAVCELVVCQEEDADGGLTYVEERYGEREYHLGNLLTNSLHLFSKEDQDFIRREASNGDAFSLLSDCFRSEPAGFEVIRVGGDHGKDQG